jgi:hypothetical protein
MSAVQAGASIDLRSRQRTCSDAGASPIARASARGPFPLSDTPNPPRYDGDSMPILRDGRVDRAAHLHRGANVGSVARILLVRKNLGLGRGKRRGGRVNPLRVGDEDVTVFVPCGHCMTYGPPLPEDAFGYSEAIFATSNLIGVAYAPRFKNLKRQRRYIFRSRQSVDRSSWKIQPPGLRRRGSHHSVLGRHPALHCHDQTQGNDRLGHLPPPQFLLQATRPVPSPEGLRAALENSLHSACDRRAGVAHGH